MNRPFGLLARFYDRVSPGIAGMNRCARKKVLGKALLSARVVCDLACGSGDTAIDLARGDRRLARGHRGLARGGRRVHAVDSSPTFLATVRSKAARAGVRVRTHRADMRSFRLPEEVDLLLCEFAALNALDRRSQLARVLRCAARALKPGGIFAFDVNTPLSFATQVPPGGHYMEDPEFKLVMRGTVEDGGMRVPLHLEWFLPERGRYRHVRETIVHVCWTEKEIRKELARAGFGKIRTFDGADVRPKAMKTPRGTDLYFRAEKTLGKRR